MAKREVSYFFSFQSLIDLAENPLDRRALVSLKKHLEIDQPNNKLLSVSEFLKIIFTFLIPPFFSIISRVFHMC